MKICMAQQQQPNQSGMIIQQEQQQNLGQQQQPNIFNNQTDSSTNQSSSSMINIGCNNNQMIGQPNSMKQQLVPYRSGHKLESLDQFERSFGVVEITELELVWSSKGNSIKFITVSM